MRQTAHVIVDSAVYDHGVRRAKDTDFGLLREASLEPGAFVWIGLHEPSPEEFDAVRQEFELHDLVVEDALKAHQRPKLEVYDGTLLVVLKTARYVEPDEIAFAELQLIIGETFVITVRHGEASALRDVRAALQGSPELLAHGPVAVLYGVADRVVDDYAPVVDALELDVQEVEIQVFSDDRGNPAERIYKLKREVLDGLRNVTPLMDVLTPLMRGEVRWCPEALTEYFRDVADHLQRVLGRIEMTRDLLTDALDANLAQVSVRQNDDMRTISAWAAIIAAPTMLAGVWGMNFSHMPELDAALGYPLALALMFTIAVTLWRTFKHSGWL
ncbi:MAG: Mg2 transporter protein CorA family protein [Acidimicrobiales bacterium]|nr:Mg2 transporter protein CorA family protein [Acidimicrobiales bacterium]